MTENPKEPEKFVIPSRAAHNKFIRLIWKLCVVTAVVCFLFMGGAVAVMKLCGYDAKAIVEVQLIIVYIILPAYAIGYVAPTLATSLIKMSLGVEMSRQGLDIANQTATILTDFQNDVKPMMQDGKEMFREAKPVVADVKEMVQSFKKEDFGKMRESLHRLERELDGGGKFDRLVNALEKIAARSDQKADDALEGLLEEAWGKAPEKGPEVDTPEGT